MKPDSCIVPGCTRTYSYPGYHLKLGRCNTHYQRLAKRGTDALPPKGPAATAHPLYRRWKNMRSRVLSKTHPRYADWGGRGITIAPEWDDFWIYADYVQSLPHALEPGRTLDRIDNDGNYEPGNLRWATGTEQNVNQRMRKDNTSGIKNIYWVKRSHSWVAMYQRKREVRRLGPFKTRAEAAHALEREFAS